MLRKEYPASLFLFFIVVIFAFMITINPASSINTLATTCDSTCKAQGYSFGSCREGTSSVNGMLHVCGTNICDANGNVVLLVGNQIDYNIARGGHDSDAPAGQDHWYNQSDVQRIKSYGGSVIDTNDLRIGDFMPQRGIINEAQFIKTWDKWYSWAEQNKIYYIVSFQNLGDSTWGSQANWLVEGKYPQPWDKYTYWQAEIDFYNTSNPLQSDNRQAYIELWKFIANRYKNNSYAIFNIGTNEPFAGNQLVVSSNAEKVSSDFVNYVAQVFDAIRSTGAQNLIFVDKPYCWFYTNNYQPVNRDIVIEDHNYVTNSRSFDSWHTNYIDKWVQKYVNVFHKPFYIGEYGFIDNSGSYKDKNGNPIYGLIFDKFPNWQQVLQNEVNYLKTLPLVGYTWHEYPWLDGEWYDWYYTKYNGIDCFTPAESNWILQTTLGGTSTNTNLAVVPNDWSLTYGNGPQIIHLDYNVTHNGHVSIRLDPHTNADVNTARECDGTWYAVKPGDHIVAKCWIQVTSSGFGDTNPFSGARIGIDFYSNLPGLSNNGLLPASAFWRTYYSGDESKAYAHWGTVGWVQKTLDFIVPVTVGDNSGNPQVPTSLVMWMQVWSSTYGGTDPGKAWFSDCELYINPTSGTCQSGESSIGQDGCSSGLCCCSGTAQTCSSLSYPTDKWQRVWYNHSTSACLGNGPDQTLTTFDDNWASGTVAYNLADDIQFSSSRTINFATAGTYNFTLGSDDGARLWIDDALQIDKWVDRAYITDSVTLSLAAGNHKFRIDYYENAGVARVSFNYAATAATCDSTCKAQNFSSGKCEITSSSQFPTKTVTWSDGTTETLQVDDKGKIFLNGKEVIAVGFHLKHGVPNPNQTVADSMLQRLSNDGVRFMTFNFAGWETDQQILDDINLWMPLLQKYRMWTFLSVQHVQEGNLGPPLDVTTQMVRHQYVINKISANPTWASMIYGYTNAWELDMWVGKGYTESQLITYLMAMNTQLHNSLSASNIGLVPILNKPISPENQQGNVAMGQIADLVGMDAYAQVEPTTGQFHQNYIDEMNVLYNTYLGQCGKAGSHVWHTEWGTFTGVWPNQVLGNSWITSSLLSQAINESGYGTAGSIMIWNMWNDVSSGQGVWSAFNPGGTPKDWYTKIVPVFQKAISKSGSTFSSCQSGEISVGQDGCSSNNLCCCKITTTLITTTPPTTISSYKDLTCSGSSSHYCSATYKSIDSVDSITIPSSANCGDTIPVTAYWTGRHNYNDNHWGFFLETVSSQPSTYLYYLSSCKSYIADSGTNSYRMVCNIKMPAAGSVNNGNYNFWVTGEDYNGYCNPGEVGVDAQIYKPIILNNCQAGITTTIGTTTIATTTVATSSIITTIITTTTIPINTNIVSVDSSKVIGANNFSIGLMTDWSWPGFVSNSARKQLVKDANFKLVRVFDFRSSSPKIMPCSNWDTTKNNCTLWDWTQVDLFTQAVFEVGAEPMFTLGWPDADTSVTSQRIPPGMPINSTTGLPNPNVYAVYAAEWVKHFKQKGWNVRYYEIANEPFAYFGWNPSSNNPKLAYFVEFWNVVARAMRAVNPNIKISQDAITQTNVLDYWILHGDYIDYLDFHKYDCGTWDQSSSSYYSDSKLFAYAESLRLENNIGSTYGVKEAQQKWLTSRGKLLPVIDSEGNLNSAWRNGTDPRIQKMTGAVWTALTLRAEILKGVNYNVYYEFSSNGNSEHQKTSTGYGFGMINSYNNIPWYPYYVQKWIGNNLNVGDNLLQSTSSSSNIRILSWVSNGKLNILLIHNSTAIETVSLNGMTGQLSYQKIDDPTGTSYLNPIVQNDTINAGNTITLNGYTVMLLQQSMGQTTTTISTTSIATTTIKPTTTTTTIKPSPTTTIIQSSTTTTATSVTTTTPSSYKDLTCSGSTSHYCSLNYKSIDSVDSITIPSSANCGDTIPVTVYWTGRHNTNDNHWGFFLETVSSQPSTYLYYLSSCKSYIADSGTNSYRMVCNIKMPAAGSVNNGNYNFWVTGEDYNGYCNPGEVGVDAQKYKIITLSNC